MIINNIHDTWGSVVTFDRPLDFFNQDINFWRDMLYKRKLIVFKKMNWTEKAYAKFGLRFGQPWAPDEYYYSNEMPKTLVTDLGPLTISPFTSKTDKGLKMSGMPWHSDIPNRSENPFPFRSLWIVKNPNPENSGITGWMNLELALDKLTPEWQSLLPRVTVIQQSWYEPGTDLQEHSIIKVHPITGQQSLRLNYFNEGTRKDAWICGVKIDGVLQSDCSLIRQLLEYCEQHQSLLYHHTWDTNDVVIYDNWTFVHNRTKLQFDEEQGLERFFFRINVHHVPDAKWSQGQ